MYDIRAHSKYSSSTVVVRSMLLSVSAVQLYCVLLCNCTHMVGEWVASWSVEGAIAVRLYCPTPTFARLHSLARSIALSIAHRHHRPGVLGPMSSNARRRPIACSVAHQPSLARRRPLARSPALARSFARRRSPAAALVVLKTQFHTIYTRSFGCVLYFILMKDIGR